MNKHRPAPRTPRRAERTDTAGILSVMMPVFNEERTLRMILTHVLAQPEVGEVIAVDDGSTDGSWSILQELASADHRLKLHRMPQNRGKGAALRHAIGQLRMPFALVQDADMEYDPRDYRSLLLPLVEGQADVVYGVRGFSGQTAYNFWFVMGNRLVSLVCNVLFNCYISDLETGFKALRSELWKRLNLRAERFDIEPEVTARILRAGYRVHEVAIHYYARSRQEGKKLSWKDGVRAVATLAWLRLAPGRGLFPEGEGDAEYHANRKVALASWHPLLKSRASTPFTDPAS